MLKQQKQKALAWVFSLLKISLLLIKERFGLNQKKDRGQLSTLHCRLKEILYNNMAKKILIIEDDKFLRELIVRKLAAENYEVNEAIEGDEGLKKIEEQKPDLVLLDLILPGIDGFEVLSRMKKNPDLAKIPVIILSNLGQKEEIERGLNLGANDYLIKAHFTPKEIIGKIKETLK